MLTALRPEIFCQNGRMKFKTFTAIICYLIISLERKILQTDRIKYIKSNEKKHNMNTNGRNGVLIILAKNVCVRTNYTKARKNDETK